jgi:Reverse transcriptase (RNA-dependent DNA polymerase)
VAQGFSQVPGKYFMDIHAPVMTDLAFFIALIIFVLMKLHSGQFDVETELIDSKLDEEIYIRIPEDFVIYMIEVHTKVIDTCKKEFFGLLQAASHWWK